MKKEQFKKIVKECVRECLKEIISEQIVPENIISKIVGPIKNESVMLKENAIQKQLSHQTKKMNDKNDVYSLGDIGPADRLKQIMQQDRTKSKMHDSKLDVPVNNVKSVNESIMADIFNDTARTTYAKQAEVGHVLPSHADSGVSYIVPTDKYAEVVMKSDPADLFNLKSDYMEKLVFGKKT